MKLKMYFTSRSALAVICAASVQYAIAADSTPILRADSLPETTPWSLEELSKPPEFEWAAGKEVRSLSYKSEPFKGKGTRVFAHYATPGTLAGDPTMDKNLPAIVLVHGGGGKAYAEWAKLWASRGFAAIAMDHGRGGKSSEKGPGLNDDVIFGDIDDPVTDQWPYHAVAAVIRAHSLIRSFPEVDSKRIALTGISWGGYLTCIVAGLDNRFRVAVPVYGCGFLSGNSAWVGKYFDKMTAENRAKWVKLWDPSQYVGSANMPMLFVNGGKDYCFRTDSYAKTYSLVKAKNKNIRFTPDLPHGHIFDRPGEIEVFINHHLNNGPPLPKVISIEVGTKKVTALVETTTRLVSAKLYYTMDLHIGTGGLSYDFNKGGRPWKAGRTWIEKPASIDRHSIIAEHPPTNSTAWFLTVTDERKVLVSSEIMLPGEKTHNKSDAVDAKSPRMIRGVKQEKQ